ncbi:DUF3299 domain-containing protein [Pacificoceanicola onchidii]|uniref:DUF3299 domain-containing protein n=1 Tax=Pacificoceanicola onchidii TaxID=2562685 RepID=UPI0010A37F84|nr:DUF3299 domain-containing protein [Pacificoceanicola onchidii]
MTDRLTFSRRTFGLSLAATLLPREGRADGFSTITWDDLIPPGVPYSEIIGEGEMDEVADTWKPIFDANAFKFNEVLEGAAIRMPGFVLPMEMTAEGVTSFILVPYEGACVHVPPPPPNQLVFVTTKTPWASNEPWQAVWVSGRMSTKIRSTDVAEVGYSLVAEKMELYRW